MLHRHARSPDCDMFSHHRATSPRWTGFHAMQLRMAVSVKKLVRRCLIIVISVGFRSLFHHPAILCNQVTDTHACFMDSTRANESDDYGMECRLCKVDHHGASSVDKPLHADMPAMRWHRMQRAMVMHDDAGTGTVAYLFQGRGEGGARSQGAFCIDDRPQLLSSILSLRQLGCCAIHVPSMKAVYSLLCELLYICAAQVLVMLNGAGKSPIPMGSQAHTWGIPRLSLITFSRFSS